MKKKKFTFNEEDVINEIAITDWTTAKSYEDFAPHQYITRRQNPELCYMFDIIIETNGKKEKFRWDTGFKYYTYYYIDKYKYWFTNKGFVLNRCNKEQYNAKNYKEE